MLLPLGKHKKKLHVMISVFANAGRKDHGKLPGKQTRLRFSRRVCNKSNCERGGNESQTEETRRDEDSITHENPTSLSVCTAASPLNLCSENLEEKKGEKRKRTGESSLVPRRTTTGEDLFRRLNKSTVNIIITKISAFYDYEGREVKKQFFQNVDKTRQINITL